MHMQLQGFAVKGQVLPWLHYTHDLARGYASPYHRLKNDYSLVFRYTAFFISYLLFHVIIMMLVYNSRKIIYDKAYNYMNRNRRNCSLFSSFIVTSFTTFIAMTYMSFITNGFCLNVLQIILLCITLMCAIPHLLIATFCVHRSPDFFTMASEIWFIKSICCNHCIQILIFGFIFTLPHVGLLFIFLYSTNFFYNPLSYIVLFTYFSISLVVLWIADALFLYMGYPFYGLKCFSKTRKGRKRMFFAYCVLFAFNSLNFTVWAFVSIYFYDHRGQAASFITLLPGMILTVLGWYFSGHTKKLFDLFSVKSSLPVTSNKDGSSGGDIPYSMLTDQSRSRRNTAHQLLGMLQALRHHPDEHTENEMAKSV